METFNVPLKGKGLSVSPLFIKTTKLTFSFIIFLVLWFLPSEIFGIDGLSITEHRVISIFIFATFMWVLEAVPAWTTSLLIVVMLLLTVSDSSLWFFIQGIPADKLGQLVKYQSIMHCFADPIIMLFIGGFILAIAAIKSGLDSMLVRVLLKPFGTQTRYIQLGFILITGIFSMFLSNSATTAMMLTLLIPILKALPADDKGKIGMALAIPFAANIGGMGTPIGTPPNAIALKFLNDPDGLNANIGFGDWMLLMVPFTFLLLFIAWFILLRFFPFKQKHIQLKLEGETKKDWQSIVIYITFAVTILLWMSDKVTGINPNVVAMIPVAVLCITGIITQQDLAQINWSVLWMVAGGFALGVALNETGLAQNAISAIPFNAWSPLIIILGTGFICYAMSNFISNTATVALLAPILAVVGISMRETLYSLGGVSTLLIGLAISASLAMVLPISTPPNAMAHATGIIKQKDMAKVGLIIGIVGFALGYMMLIIMGSYLLS